MLIDGHSMAFRAYYALPPEKFNTSGGQATNAVYGFLTMLNTLIAQEKPTHVATAFDVGRHTFRTEIFSEYKAQRDATPEPFRGQVDLIKKVLNPLGITWIEKTNYEADDIIATLATAAKDKGFETLIVTGDRDSFQLINDTTTVLYPMKGVSVLHRFTPEAVEEKYGVTPAQYPDLAALRGDNSDNLPGVPGVGEKTATKWITKYGNLDGVIEHADEIGGKVGGNFRERIDQVKLNRQITEMVRDLALPVGVEDVELKPVDKNAVNAEFDALEFGSHLRERVFTAFAATTEDDGQPSEDFTVEVVDGAVRPWLDAHAAEGISVVVQGNPDPAGGDAEVIALVGVDGTGMVCDLGQLSEADEQAVAEWLDSESPKFCHDIKKNWHMLTGRGFVPRGFVQDTALAAYLLQPGQRSFDFDDVLLRHLQAELPSADDGGQLTLLDAPDHQHLLRKARAVAVLAEHLVSQLHAIGAYELYRDVEIPLATVLARMEHTGIAVDVDILERERDIFVGEVEDAQAQARQLADDDSLNLSSPKQLQAVLFETLGMPKTKKTKTGYSTAAKEIEQLAKNHPHPFLDQLLRHRENQKLKTTIDGLIKAVADDGRIHTTFQQTSTATGRLSSTDPNLQNIPVRTPAGRRIRSAFVVGKDFDSLLTADYSQIEMRVMAHLSKDAGLIEAYRKGEDLHNYVGSKVFDVPVDQVTPEIRRRVKAMSYGLVYGLSAFGLAGQLDIAPGEAKRIMENYFLRFGGVKRYLETVVDEARDTGYTATLFGRRRYLPELSSTNRVARENAERSALNAPIQGTAADIIKVAMLRVDRQLLDRQLKSRVLLQVHDELVVEVAAGEQQLVGDIVREQMSAAISLAVPMDVSSGVGENWDAAAH
ncbi:DNA polymerase I [Corynebacterium aquilae]|uniref:DNA polymerase I n=1 Tax=Corynebacterium aquilae DSM 44791 TaxID=1431546 RepID=A0A1L7CFN6_9CORY|nr:DNA polymerase I [Corynebacterium aquilae]APT84657.1 DNA polymerase I [Corynebacterium aquilae DSM 44791]